MTNQQHPITPSFELLQDWEGRFYDQQLTFDELVTEVYKAGADQQLEGCCEWVANKLTFREDGIRFAGELRAARRSKPPSLKEQALSELDTLEDMGACNSKTIRRALEQLND
jgi:hypothetical protein